MLPRSFSRSGRAVLARLPKPFVEQAEQEVAVEGVELVLALFLLAAVEPVAEVIGVAVEEALALDEIDEHQAVEHDGGIPLAVGLPPSMPSMNLRKALRWVSKSR